MSLAFKNADSCDIMGTEREPVKGNGIGSGDSI
jgi:hypothetical protein